VRSTADGQIVKSLHAPGHRAGPLAFSPDDKWLASGDINSTSTILLWDLKVNQVIATLIGHPAGGGVSDVAFSGDGNHLVSVGGRLYETGEVRLWDVKEILSRK
jgi:WD40 repeat protein